VDQRVDGPPRKFNGERDNLSAAMPNMDGVSASGVHELYELLIKPRG